jgi:hypothetical protein
MHKALIVGSSSVPTGSITLTTDSDVSRTLSLGASTANHVAIFGSSNQLTSEAQLDTTRGGTGIGTYAKGDILYSDATDSLARLAAGSTGQALRIVDGVPE